MKKLISLFIGAICISTIVYAEWKAFETTNEARQRHSAERYWTYQNNGYNAPLGGYREKLGDTAPYGTERPGYNPPNGYDSSYKYNNSGW